MALYLRSVEEKGGFLLSLWSDDDKTAGSIVADIVTCLGLVTRTKQINGSVERSQSIQGTITKTVQVRGGI